MVRTSVWRRINDAANLNVEFGVSLFILFECDFAGYCDGIRWGDFVWPSIDTVMNKVRYI